jgi:hypothetical protein
VRSKRDARAPMRSARADAQCSFCDGTVHGTQAQGLERWARHVACRVLGA